MNRRCLPLLLFFLCHEARAVPETPPELPLPVTSFGAASTEDGTLYSYGGHSGKKHWYNNEEVHGSLFRWQRGAARWEELPGDEPAQGASLVAAPGGLIRIGGMAAHNPPNQKQDLRSTATVSRYDLQAGRWEKLPPMPQPRSSHDSTRVGDVLYVIGGWQMRGTGQETQWHDSYVTLDLKKPEAGWRQHMQPFKLRGLTVEAVGASVYAIGGMDDHDEMTGAVWVLDTATGKWAPGPSLPNDKFGGFGFDAVNADGRLLASGAAGALLELRENEWQQISRLQHPRYFHRLLRSAPGQLIALGGEDRQGNKAPPEVIAIPAKNAAAESDWPRFQGPRGDNSTPETGWRTDWPADGPRIAWKAELGKGMASFAVVGQRVYTAGNDGADKDTCWCLNLETGKPNWKHEIPVRTQPHEMSIVPPGPAATPAVADGLVYFNSREGDLLCLEADTGKVIWHKKLVKDLGGKRPVYGYANSPAVHAGHLYLDLGGAKSTACLDAKTGNVIWQAGEGEAGYATPYLTRREGQDVLVLFKGEALELRAAADGKLIARHATQTRDFCNCATPARSGDLFFISHTGNMGARVLTWKGEDLSELWTDPNIGLLFQSGLPWKNNLLVFNDQQRGVNDLRLLDLTTGKALWKTAELDKGSGLICDDGHALFLTAKGELALAQISAEKLEIQQRVQVLGGKCWAQPVLSHRHILCRNNEGSMVCLDLR